MVDTEQDVYKSANLSSFMKIFPEDEYITEEFVVETEDGYLIKLFRVQNHKTHKNVKYVIKNDCKIDRNLPLKNIRFCFNMD